MNFRNSLLLCALYSWGFALVPFAAAQNNTEPSSYQNQTSQTILVLKNGQVLEGQLSRDANRVFVQTRNGSSIIISADQVDFVCGTMRQAYWQRLARTRATDVDGQIALFMWCLQHELVDEARNQIDLLQEMEIPATRLEMLHRQLLVVENRLAPQHPVASNDSAPTPVHVHTPSTTSLTDADTKPHPRPTIRQVGFEASLGASREIERQRRQKSMESTIERLSRKTVGNFKRQAEPAIVRACYDCHSEDDRAMPLFRLGLNQVIPRRMSQRNLVSILQHIDSESPEQSALWLAATRPHASREKPLITPGSTPYQNLMQWVLNASSELRATGGNIVAEDEFDASIAENPAKRDLDGGNARTNAPLTSHSGKPLTIAPRGMYPGINDSSVSHNSSPTPPEPAPPLPMIDSHLGSSAPAIPALSATRPLREASTDPFDPAEYNQRYAHRRGARPTQSPSR